MVNLVKLFRTCSLCRGYLIIKIRCCPGWLISWLPGITSTGIPAACTRSSFSASASWFAFSPFWERSPLKTSADGCAVRTSSRKCLRDLIQIRHDRPHHFPSYRYQTPTGNLSSAGTDSEDPSPARWSAAYKLSLPVPSGTLFSFIQLFPEIRRFKSRFYIEAFSSASSVSLPRRMIHHPPDSAAPFFHSPPHRRHLSQLRSFRPGCMLFPCIRHQPYNQKKCEDQQQTVPPAPGDICLNCFMPAPVSAHCSYLSGFTRRQRTVVLAATLRSKLIRSALRVILLHDPCQCLSFLPRDQPHGITVQCRRHS